MSLPELGLRRLPEASNTFKLQQSRANPRSEKLDTNATTRLAGLSYALYGVSN